MKCRGSLLVLRLMASSIPFAMLRGVTILARVRRQKGMFVRGVLGLKLTRREEKN